eukprot:jgi/Botrbrau1/1723/Bobra.116_2s0065.1
MGVVLGDPCMTNVYITSSLLDVQRDPTRCSSALDILTGWLTPPPSFLPVKGDPIKNDFAKETKMCEK